MNFIRQSIARTFSVIFIMVGICFIGLTALLTFVAIFDKEWLLIILSVVSMGLMVSCFKASQRLW